MRVSAWNFVWRLRVRRSPDPAESSRNGPRKPRNIRPCLALARHRASAKKQCHTHPPLACCGDTDLRPPLDTAPDPPSTHRECVRGQDAQRSSPTACTWPEPPSLAARRPIAQAPLGNRRPGLLPWPKTLPPHPFFFSTPSPPTTQVLSDSAIHSNLRGAPRQRAATAKKNSSRMREVPARAPRRQAHAPSLFSPACLFDDLRETVFSLKMANR